MADPSTDNGAKEVAAMAGKISGNKLVKNSNKLAYARRFHIELSLLTRRSIEDHATRSRRRQMQAVSTRTRSRRRRITLPHVSLVDEPET